ncbi:MAG: hypothetical protein AAB783_01155 [Patescibacteria group bacterium]
MNKHIVIIYIVLVVLAIFVFIKQEDNDGLSKLESRITRVEFFQEATRIRDNVVGFKQVNVSLASNVERSKSCNESMDLLTEWSEDIKKLGLDHTDYMGANQDAKSYFDSISKIYDSIIADCNKLTNK